MSEPQSPEQADIPTRTPSPEPKIFTAEELSHTSEQAQASIRKATRKGILAKVAGKLGLRNKLETDLLDTRLKQAEANAKYLDTTQQLEVAEEAANIDHLTKLHNRRWFMERLDEEISYSVRTGNPCAVLFFDADGFKRVNDEYSHETGDDLLKLMASLNHRKEEPMARFGSQKKGDNNIEFARLGGDEFVLLIRDYKDIKQIKGIMRRFSKEFSEKSKELLETSKVNPQHDAKNAIRESSLSMGAAIFNEGDTPKTLLDRADSAMYVTKSSEGKGIKHGFVKNADGTTTEIFFDPKDDYFASLKNPERDLMGNIIESMKDQQITGSVQAIIEPTVEPETNSEMLSLYLTLDEDTEKGGTMFETSTNRFHHFNTAVSTILSGLPPGYNFSLETNPPQQENGSINLLTDGSFVIKFDNPEMRPIEIRPTPDREFKPFMNVPTVELAKVS